MQPLRVVLPQQCAPALGEVKAGGEAGLRRQPPRQKVAAQGHAHLAVVCDLGIGALQVDLRVHEAAL